VSRGKALIELHREVHGVDLDEKVTSLDRLVVGDEHLEHSSCHLRRHMDDVTVDDGVCRFMTAIRDVVVDTDHHGGKRHHHFRGEYHAPPPIAVSTGCSGGRGAVRFAHRQRLWCSSPG
jgi:hypothetical protein